MGTLIRGLWQVISLLPGGKRNVPPPGMVLVFNELPPEALLKKLIETYIEVYALPPWNEKWKPEKVKAKLQAEVSGGILVLLWKEGMVAGFSWGAIITPQEVIPRVVASFPELNEEEAKRGLERLLPLLPPRIFYWDEIALLPPFRKGLEPLRLLILPPLQFAWKNRIRVVLFRTTPAAKIVPLARFMGFEKIFEREVSGMIEIYLYLPDILPLLRIAQAADAHLVSWVMSVLYRAGIK
jgi:hypothetical protein